MMTSVGVERTRGTRDKALPTNTQTTQPQKQLQVSKQQLLIETIENSEMHTMRVSQNTE